MRQMVESGLVLREWARGTLPGLRRVCGVMWCFVVRTSQMSSASVGEGEEDVSRVFFEVEEVSWAALVEMCARRAVEALWSWGG